MNPWDYVIQRWKLDIKFFLSGGWIGLVVLLIIVGLFIWWLHKH